MCRQASRKVQKNAVEIDRHACMPVLSRYIRERRAAPANASVGDIGGNEVKPAEPTHRIADAGSLCSLVRYINLRNQYAPALHLKRLARGSVLFRIRSPDDDIGAGPGERLGHPQPDAAVAPVTSATLPVRSKGR